MATSRAREAELFSSSPARPSHTRNPPQQSKPQNDSTQRKSLKRTASVAALCTPPASPEKEKLKHRSRGRTGSDDEDEDDDAMELSPSSPVAPGLRHNNRSKGKARVPPKNTQVRAAKRGPLEVGGVGRLFLNGAESSQKVHTMPLMAQPSFVPNLKRNDETRSAAEQVDKMNLDTDSEASPVLPVTPRMNQRATSDLPLPPQFAKRPSTPTRRTSKKKAAGPVRDSPNNPFLSSSPPKAPVVREPLGEQPTITYVFRGVKAVFRNPAYGLAEPGEDHPSRLPPSHPDFSPDMLTAPKLLFPHPAGTADSDDDAEDVPRRKRETKATGSRKAQGPNKRIRLEEHRGNPFVTGSRTRSFAEDEEKCATAVAMAHGPTRK